MEEKVPVHPPDSASDKDLDARHVGYVHGCRDSRCTMQSLTQNQWQITNRGLSNLRAEPCQLLLSFIRISRHRHRFTSSVTILDAPVVNY